jgi:peroxiredoxin
MKNKFALIVLMLIVSISFNSNAAGYLIKVKVVGLDTDTCYLGHYYGQYQYITDTAIANTKGELVFQGSEDLAGGIYFIVLPGKKFFELIVNKEQNMSFETDTADFAKYMKVKGSKENSVFYEYLNFINGQQKTYEVFKKKSQGFPANKDSTDFYIKKMQQIDNAVKEYKMNFIKINPDFLIAKVFKASKDPDIPDAPILPNGRKDSLFNYRYYKEHYWDNLDFSDDRLLRTPVFYNRLSNFMNNVVAQTPDSIMKEADKLIEKARVNKEVFKYVVWYMTYTYETSNIMGFDAIFVHMVETYYMTNQCFWVSPKILENLTKRAEKLKPILLGNIAPNLIMQDTSLNLQSLHGVKAKYTVLLFWDPECGHCQTEVPSFHHTYDSLKTILGMEVFAVCTDTNMVKMKDFIKKHKLDWINVNGPRAITPPYAETYDIYSTPVFFILDEKKTIIAKRIGYDNVASFIQGDLKRKTMVKP